MVLRRHTWRRGLPALTAMLLLAGGAWAAAGDTVDHVRVNGAGRNSTNTFSTTLYVDVALVSGYTRLNFDGDAGNWDGPGYHASLKPTSVGATHLGWGVAFELASRKSLEDFAKQFALDFGSWRILQEGPMAIPHVVGGTRVGTIKGLMMLTQGPGDTASAFDSAVAFPLCKGVIVAAHFSTLSPLTNSAGPNGTYLVDDGSDVQAWNRSHISAALDGVALNGYLPVARLTAAARGRTVRGVVSDCIGHPVPGATVKVGTTRAVTSASGAYAAHVKRPGTYAVSVSAGGGSARRAVRIR